MNRYIHCILLVFALTLPGVFAHAQEEAMPSFSEIRSSFETQIKYDGSDGEALPTPPKNTFELIKYKSDVGPLAAYITPDPKDGRKHPAIIWITGGFSNSLGEMWEPNDRSNDQSAAAYRKAGVVTMFPSLRGGNDNPGKAEGFFGEVDDILAAHKYLSNLPFVDPARIYLGGHSTGGTLVMLVAESSPTFKATFAFGPVSATSYYGDFLFGGADMETMPEIEVYVRAPILWLDEVKSPLYVIEGEIHGNIDNLLDMKSKTKNPNITFIDIPKHGHFDILAPINELIATKILKENPITLTRKDVIAKMAKE